MKNILKVALIGATGLLFSFSGRRKDKFLPPGTVRINDTLFADETEISNRAWCEYEFWTRARYGKISVEHLRTLPDTSVWKSVGNLPYVKFYYRHPVYRNHPVVGISYEQASAFTKWRTERVKEYMARSKKNHHIKIDFRLPTRKEWEQVSMDSSFVFYNKKNTHGLHRQNCRRTPENKLTEIAGDEDVTAPVYSYWKNAFGLYNCIGNVAEMVFEKGISKGGSWLHAPEECQINKNIPYAGPEAWLGFRCVCIVRRASP